VVVRSPFQTAKAEDIFIEREQASKQIVNGSSSIFQWIAPNLLGAILIIMWQLLIQFHVFATYILPAPVDVFKSFKLNIENGILTEAISATVTESIFGFILGTIVAIPLGYVIVRIPLIARLIEPYIAMSQALPAVALAPLLVLWFGYDMLPIVLLCALIVFFPITVSTVLGLRGLDHDILDASELDGAGRWARLWSIEFPLALPSILAGLRAGLTYSVTGAVIGEFVINMQGLGGLLLIARGNFDTPLVFATLVALALLAGLMYGIGRLIERSNSYLEVE
jgi:NitT/TauT family transport system permease protein